MIKQRILLTEIPEDKYIRYTRSHNLGNIRGENLHIWAVERKKIISRKVKYISTKNYTTNFEWLAAVCLMHADISS